MDQLLRWRAHAVPAILTAATLGACAANGSTLLSPSNTATGTAGEATGTTIWQARKFGWVRLVDSEPGAAPLDHPVQLDPDSLGEVLAGITVELPELERTNRVFTRDEIDVLVPALVRGLAMAGPAQEIVFATTATRRLTLFVNKPSVNTGRVFVEDGRFNLILGHVNAGYTEQLSDDGYLRDFEPGTRKAPLGIREQWQIDSRTSGWDRRREDWMAAPVRRASGPLPALAGEPDASVEPAAGAGAPAAAPAPQPAAAPAAAPSARDGYDVLKRRLEVLKELHQDGLITDEEFERKRGELLNEL